MLVIPSVGFILFQIWRLQRKGLNTEKQTTKSILDLLVFFATTVLGIKTSILPTSSIRKKKWGSRVMVLLNHPSVIDAVGMCYFHRTYFPNHDPIFVIKKNFGELPILGKYYIENHILLDKNISEEELKQQFEDLLADRSDPFVLYLFPEGTTFCKETIARSRQTEDGRSLKRLLYTRSKALNTFLPFCETVLDLTIMHHGAHCEYFSNLLYGSYPFHTILYPQDITDRFKNSTDPGLELKALWREKDAFLSETPLYQYPEFVDMCGVWIHLWLVMLDFFIRQKAGPLVFGLFFVYSCFENYVWKRHNYLNKACFLLYFLSNPGLLFLFHIFVNSLFTFRVILATPPSLFQI